MGERGGRSLSELAYLDIKEKIVNMTYPPRQILSEVMLAESLGISRMPIRIAMKQLVEEGWLDNSNPRKVRVKDITEEDVNEVYDIREMIESSALRRIFEEDKTWQYSFDLEVIVLRMKENMQDLLKNEQYDAAFHAHLVTVFQNKRLEKIFRSNREEIVRMGLFQHRNSDYTKKNIEELMQILMYIREKDYKMASEAHLRHLQGGRNGTIKIIREMNEEISLKETKLHRE